MGGGGGVVGGAGADMPGDKAQLCKLIQQKLNVVFLFPFFSFRPGVQGGLGKQRLVASKECPFSR